MKSKITVLPGDGIGVEVTREAIACLETIAKKFGHEFEFNEQLIGGVALDKTGVPLPDATLQACLASDVPIRRCHTPAAMLCPASSRLRARCVPRPWPPR